MVCRETDIDKINRIANSDAVRPFIDYRGVSEPMDFTPAVDRLGLTGILWLSDGDALACFAQTGERTWQAHLLFGAAVRGRAALEAAKGMLAYLKPWADTVWGAIPLRNKRVLWFARMLGFVETGRDVWAAEGDVALVELAL